MSIHVLQKSAMGPDEISRLVAPISKPCAPWSQKSQRSHNRDRSEKDNRDRSNWRSRPRSDFQDRNHGPWNPAGCLSERPTSSGCTHLYGVISRFSVSLIRCTGARDEPFCTTGISARLRAFRSACCAERSDLNLWTRMAPSVIARVGSGFRIVGPIALGAGAIIQAHGV